MQEERRLNKLNEMLIVSGTGVITFGFWTVIKVFLMLIFKFDEINDLMDGDLTNPEQRWDVILIMIIVCLIIIGIRSYVGLSARAEGMGRHKRVSYIIVAVFMLVFEVAGTIEGLDMLVDASFDKTVDNVIELLVDITSYIILIQMIISAIGVRIVKARRRGGKADE